MIDKGYYKDIPQLAKPKGNERQGFRGDDAYGGGTTAGGQRSGGERGDGPSRNVTTKSGDTFSIGDPTIDEKVDFFDKSYVGPGLFGFGGGYRDTVLPNTTQYGNKSRLGSLIASGIGALAGVPGLGFLSDIGPFNNKAFFDTKVADKTDLDYDEYMDARMAGKIDAYGNPINSSGGGGISTLPLFTQTPVSTGVETLEEEPQEMSFLERLRQNLGLV